MLHVGSEELSVADVYASVADTPSAGGIDMFIGVVRNEDGGCEVSELGYTAHPKVNDFLRQAVEETVSKYPVHAVSAVHRIGDLRIGDIAVIVAVACPKRGEARRSRPAGRSSRISSSPSRSGRTSGSLTAVPNGSLPKDQRGNWPWLR